MADSQRFQTERTYPSLPVEVYTYIMRVYTGIPAAWSSFRFPSAASLVGTDEGTSRCESLFLKNRLRRIDDTEFTIICDLEFTFSSVKIFQKTLL